MRYKIEVQDDTGIWTDVRGPDGGCSFRRRRRGARGAGGAVPGARADGKYAGGKRTRVIRIVEDEENW